MRLMVSCSDIIGYALLTANIVVIGDDDIFLLGADCYGFPFLHICMPYGPYVLGRADCLRHPHVSTPVVI
jgi:hypothetical protein